MLDMLLTYADKLYSLCILVLSSALIRWVLILSGQHWIRTQSATISIFLLPIVTYVITSVISGNVALSLGMVGALSIVRFRNPVKSSLELVAYFISITLGIACSVSYLWLIYLVACILIVVGGLCLIDKYYKSSGRQFFSISFSAGNISNTLELKLQKSDPSLFKCPYLIGYSTFADGVTYRFASDDRNKLIEIAEFYSADGNAVTTLSLI